MTWTKVEEYDLATDEGRTLAHRWRINTEGYTRLTIMRADLPAKGKGSKSTQSERHPGLVG